ncbi:MAG: hypothetical protein EPN17_00840 [Methylobacter sp.]|nr:MAG: hypothetical protein EPN17_00840 [Methylobacter sp.]
MPNQINKLQVSNLLNIDYAATNRLIENDAHFPKAVGKKLGTGGGLLFDRVEVQTWATRHQKGFISILAQQAIQGKLWPINKQASHG